MVNTVIFIVQSYKNNGLVRFLLFNGIYINLCGLFNTKVIFVEEQQWYYLTNSWEDKEVHTFSKGISPKVNVIAWLEFKLTVQGHSPTL